jgi:hypothetical protein
MPRRQAPLPANDDPLAAAQRRAEQVVLKIAGLLGRQMAREEFERRQGQAANDNSGSTLTPGAPK